MTITTHFKDHKRAARGGDRQRPPGRRAERLAYDHRADSPAVAPHHAIRFGSVRRLVLDRFPLGGGRVVAHGGHLCAGCSP